jgi:hypothetical protein
MGKKGGKSGKSPQQRMFRVTSQKVQIAEFYSARRLLAARSYCARSCIVERWDVLRRNLSRIRGFRHVDQKNWKSKKVVCQFSDGLLELWKLWVKDTITFKDKHAQSGVYWVPCESTSSPLPTRSTRSTDRKQVGMLTWSRLAEISRTAEDVPSDAHVPVPVNDVTKSIAVPVFSELPGV